VYLRGNEVIISDSNISVCHHVWKYRIVYMTVNQGFHFRIVTVHVVLCFAWFGNVHCWSMSSLLCFYNHKIVCCVLDMMLSFSITEMHLCVLWTKAGFWSFLFSSVDLYITDHNKSKYVTVHEFMILSFNSGTVKVELTASVAALQFYYCSLHYLQYIWVQQSLG
jgi:hypothetical protein